jgi:hypothetical protein
MKGKCRVTVRLRANRLIRFSSYVEAEDTGPAALVTPPLVMSGKLMLRVTAGMAFTVT